jgi:phage terminase small subunit
MKTIDTYIQNKYADYDDRVIEFINRVYEDCKNNNQEINNYFYCCLDLLSNQLKLYYMSVDALDSEKKLSSEDSYKRIARHPAVGILSKSHQQILDILEKLGLSPFASAKINRLKNGDGDQDAEELLDSLVK